MAIRGKVKDVKITTMGRSISGTVTDTAAKVDYAFEQPYGTELGIAVNSIVQFETVTTADGNTIAVALDPVEKGTIQSINSDGATGTITDKVGNKIDFEQNYVTELGLTAGSKVKFAPVLVGAKVIATSVRLVGNN